jgi:4-amino-4-deoxy-L-arabinose transferase-like glycosyltransferase
MLRWVPRTGSALALLAIVGLFVAWNARVIQEHYTSTITDGHYTRSVNLHTYLETGDRRFLTRLGDPSLADRPLVPRQIPYYSAYPPIGYLSTSFFYSWLGVNLESAKLSHLPFWALLLVCLFGIGQRIGGRAGGLATLTLAVLSPQFLNFSRVYVLETPATALCALSLLLLLRSRRFASLPYALLTGLAVAAALLTKWTILPFLGFVALPSMVKAFLGSRRSLWMVPVLLVQAVLLAWGALRSVPTSGCPLIWAEQGRWIPVWAMHGLLPSILGALAAGWAWWCWGRREVGLRPVLHAMWTLSLVGFLVLPWYFWNIGEIQDHVSFLGSHAERHGLNELWKLILSYYEQAFPFALMLLAGGVLSLLLSPRARLDKLTLVVGVVLFTWLTFQTGRPGGFRLGDVQARLMLPVLAMAIPLAASSVDGVEGAARALASFYRRVRPGPSFENLAGGIGASLGLVLVVVLSVSFSRLQFASQGPPRGHELANRIVTLVAEAFPPGVAPESILVVDTLGVIREEFEEVYVRNLMNNRKILTIYDNTGLAEEAGRTPCLPGPPAVLDAEGFIVLGTSGSAMDAIMNPFLAKWGRLWVEDDLIGFSSSFVYRAARRR